MNICESLGELNNELIDGIFSGLPEFNNLDQAISNSKYRYVQA